MKKYKCIQKYNGDWYIEHTEECYEDNFYKNCPIGKLCGKDDKSLWCYCGQCKQESYPLPKDIVNSFNGQLVRGITPKKRN